MTQKEASKEGNHRIVFTVWKGDRFYDIEQTQYGIMLMNEDGEGMEIDLFALLDKEFKDNF